jgi:hypothetical protein
MKTEASGAEVIFWMALIVGSLLYYWFPDSNLRYNMTYDLISSEHVHVQSKPSRCDWMYAPLGSKGCHFEKSVSEEKSDTGKVTDVYVQWSHIED